MRVLIVDSHPLFAEILGIHITASYPQVSIFEAHSIAEAIAVLGAYQRFELILLDFALAGSQEHFAGVCQIKIKTPLTPLVILADIEHTTGIMDLSRDTIWFSVGEKRYSFNTASVTGMSAFNQWLA